jgi:DNA-binding CsgD family transcriptional regulator
MGVEDLRERFSQFEYLGKQKFPMLGFPLPEYQLATEDNFPLSERSNQLQIIHWLQLHATYKLLILDSVTTLFGLTDENSNAEWNLKISPLLRDLRALGVAVILLHHSGKDSKRGLRGASAMGAMAHNIFCLTNHTDKDIDEGEAWFTLTKDKQRAGGFQFKSFAIHYYQNSAFTETYLEITEGGTRRADEALNDLQVRVIMRVVRGGITQRQIADQLGCSQSNVSQAITRAKDKGYLQTDGKPTQLWSELIDRFKNRGEE